MLYGQWIGDLAEWIRQAGMKEVVLRKGTLN